MTAGSDWRGRVGSSWADAWLQTDRAFAGIGGVLDAAVRAVAPDGGRALDIGCGAGSTAIALASARPGLTVTGVDLSDDLIAVARARATEVHFEAGDALAAARHLAPLSLLLSRHGVMFFDDPQAAFTTLADAAAPGAPLVFTCFRARGENEWARLIDDAIDGPPALTPSAPGPFAFADRAHVATLLHASGWTDVVAQAHDVPYVLGAGADPVADALDFTRRIGPAAAAIANAAPLARAAIEARLADRFTRCQVGGTVSAQAAIWLWIARKDPRR